MIIPQRWLQLCQLGLGYDMQYQPFHPNTISETSSFLASHF
jgi:hypothetical protein